MPRYMIPLRKFLSDVFADLGFDQIVEFLVHGQNQFAVLDPVHGQIMHLVRVLLQVKKLHIIVLVQFIQRLREIMLEG